MQWGMWTSLVLHRTLPLGVTVALHHPCLGARMAGSISLVGLRQAHRLRGSGTKAWKGVFVHRCQLEQASPLNAP